MLNTDKAETEDASINELLVVMCSIEVCSLEELKIALDHVDAFSTD